MEYLSKNFEFANMSFMLRKHNNGYKERDQKNLAGAGNILKAVLYVGKIGSWIDGCIKVSP